MRGAAGRDGSATRGAARPREGGAAVATIAGRLDGLAFALLAIVPLGMALLNRSAPVVLTLAALAGLAARALDGELGTVRTRLAEAVRTPVGLGCVAFLTLAAASIGWGHHPGRSASGFGELVWTAGTALVLHAALPRAIPGFAVKLAAVAVALGCLTIVAELATGMSARAALALRTDTFIFKRSVTAILIGLPPLAVLLWRQGKAPIAVATMLLLAIASVAAHSSATLLGLLAGAALAGLAALSRRVAAGLLAAGFVATLAVAPVLGDAADRLLPPGFVGKLAFAHARERIDIWQSFGEVAWRRPILGAGFGTSPVMDREPVAAEVPEERRLMLGAWHPHNAALQVWAEMGGIGALLAAAILLALALRLGRAGRWAGIAGFGVAGAAFAIMQVGHGAWQGWWWSVIGAAAIWAVRMAPDEAASSA